MALQPDRSDQIPPRRITGRSVLATFPGPHDQLNADSTGRVDTSYQAELAIVAIVSDMQVSA